MTTENYDEPDSPADLVVVGLGPAGLAVALMAAKEGKKVVALTNRTDYIRKQIVLLDSASRTFLESLKTEDDDIFKLLATGDRVEINLIEKFLYKELQKNPNVTFVNTNANPIQSVGEENNINYISLKNKRYYFHHCIAADGAKHSFTQIITQDLKLDLTYKSTDQERHLYHGSVQLKLKEDAMANSKFKQGSNDILHKMEQLEKQGWDEHYLPLDLTFSDDAIRSFYFAGEIPKKIFNAPDVERAILLKQWVAPIIQKKFGVNPDDLEFVCDDPHEPLYKLQALAFEVNPKVCEQPFMPLKKGVFTMLGDARRTPNYIFGHGINDSFVLSQAFVNSLDASSPNGFNGASYEAKIHEVDKVLGVLSSTSSSNQALIRQRGAKKLEESLTRLITHLEKNQKINKEDIDLLRNAKEGLFEKEPKLTNFYSHLTAIQPILEKHRHTNFLSQFYRFILKLYHGKATMTHSAVIMDDVKKDLSSYVHQR